MKTQLPQVIFNEKFAMLSGRWRSKSTKTKSFWVLMATLLEMCQITSQSIFAFQNIGIQRAFSLIYFNFNFDLMSDFIIFGKIIFFCK
jgi:hypothetical protein